MENSGTGGSSEQTGNDKNKGSVNDKGNNGSDKNNNSGNKGNSDNKDNSDNKGNVNNKGFSLNNFLDNAKDKLFAATGSVKDFFMMLLAGNGSGNGNGNGGNSDKNSGSSESGSTGSSDSSNSGSGSSGNVNGKDNGNNGNGNGNDKSNNGNGNGADKNNNGNGNGADKSNNGNGNGADKSNNGNGNGADKSNNGNGYGKDKQNGKDNKGKGNGKGNNGNGKDKSQKVKAWQVEPTEEDIILGYAKYTEKPDYLVDPTSEAYYTYDAAGNRTSLTTDAGTVNYTYDAANRLISDGSNDYNYDENGNLVSVQSGNDSVTYSYTASNRLAEVSYPDGSGVKYGYDAFGRKVLREEAYWKLAPGNNGNSSQAPGQQKESKSQGNGGNSIKNGSGDSGSGDSGNDKSNNGKSSQAPGQQKESKSQGNGGNSIKNGSGDSESDGNGSISNSGGVRRNVINPLKLLTETTQYQYDGFSNNVLKEYTEHGSPLGQYYTANDSVVARKMFGLHGLNGRDAGVKTTGGMMYYNYDGLRNVSELTDRNGGLIEQYRYDAFGGLYTGVTAPYNTTGFASQSYDPKASLVDMHARWYAPQNGRFITADPYQGDLLTPYTQNRYAYVGNNPINRWDPTGYREVVLEYERFEAVKLDEGSYWEYGDHTPYKGSDGWYASWTDIYYEYLVMAFNNYNRTVYDDGSYSDSLINSEINKTVWETEYSGSSFTPFTPAEWYDEHKDDLARYGTAPPPYNPPKAYTRTDTPVTKVTITNISKYSSENGLTGLPGSVLLSKEIKNKVEFPGKTYAYYTKDSGSGKSDITNGNQTSKYSTSGYEPDFEPEKWNIKYNTIEKSFLWFKWEVKEIDKESERIQNSTNCYAYALNLQSDPITGENFPRRGENGFALQPGQIAGEYYYLNEVEDGKVNTVENIEKAAKADARAMGATFERVEKGEATPTGTYKVLLVLEPDEVNGDYHWYRQNPNGTWSHKPGNTIATNREVTGIDVNGNLTYGKVILDPEKAAKEAGYTEIGGYYSVSSRTLNN